MADIRSVTLKALRISQPIGDFYIAAIDAHTLVEIAFADVRELKRDLDNYMGIQRRLDQKRVAQLCKYVRNEDATFPTSVLLAIKGESASWDESKCALTLIETESIPFDRLAKILDGQHRIAGLEGYVGPKFELSIAIFIDADLADQANIFATVNLAQTKVNKSLVYDLFDYQSARSPQKSSHNIAVAFDEIVGGPFYHRIKRLGYATAGRERETLTQATIVEELIAFMSSDPASDRDTLKRGRRLPQADSALLKKLPFRNMFIDGEDEKIGTTVHNLFVAVAKKWPNAWTGGHKGQILPKTNGFKALMQFLRESYGVFVRGEFGRVISVDEYSSFLEHVPLRESDFNTENFPPGSSGQAALKRSLRAARDAVFGPIDGDDRAGYGE